MYHGIFKKSTEIFFSSREWVHVDTFEDHCKYLHDEGYNSISMDEFLYKKQTSQLSPKDIIITFDDGAICQNEHAIPLLKKYGLKAIFYVPVNWLNKPKRFSDNNLISIVNDGMEIGSHSMNHPDFRLIDFNTQKKELVDSKQYLENIISKPVTHFSFPFGRGINIDNSVFKEIGYDTAVTVDRGINTSLTDNYKLYRIGIYGHSNLSVFKKLLNQRYFIKYYLTRFAGNFTEQVIGHARKEKFFRSIHKILEVKRFK